VLWFDASLAARCCYAGANVLDSHYRHHFGGGYSQTFYCSLYELIALPLLFLAIRPAIPAPHLWPWIVISGMFLSLYLVPYFAALHNGDSSVIAALFSLGRIFTPVLSAILLSERFTLLECLGFLITIGGAMYASYQPGNMHVGLRALLLMVFSGLMIAH
jgi:uncharacterized membrane protein